MANEPTERGSATLLMSCPDQPGLVHRISEFIFSHGGNILFADQHLDDRTGMFLSRIEWDLSDFDLQDDGIRRGFRPIADELDMSWELRLSSVPLRVAIFVSRIDHCLVDLLHRHSLGELRCQIVAIVSNHSDLEPLAARYGIPYFVFPITAENKVSQEEQELALLRDLRVDLIVLARYMQVITEQFVANYESRMINIHHSFLPAFSGARPYEQAFERGVKLIGATSHYVTAVLDDGPIIEQDAIRVTHRDDLNDFIRKGRDLERVVLARAVRLHLEGRVLRSGNKTVVFE
ncbi:MAG TPA: formyltetrahydrofolate deformylase [Chloroflexota bacterium]|nr:formyltetrahydrofolate deformylase [Chloroflexota bacterium]